MTVDFQKQPKTKAVISLSGYAKYGLSSPTAANAYKPLQFIFTFSTFSTIQFSLSMLMAGRQAYQRLQQHINLPSYSHLLKYKNFVQQRPGFLEDNLTWMELEAKRKNISSKGRQGCLIFDEMKIQVHKFSIKLFLPISQQRGYNVE